MYVVIVGCGRVGAALGSDLSSSGHNVVIIDSDEGRFQRLGRQWTGETVPGDGTDISVLKEAGIEKTDALIMATNDDNSNLMAAQIARIMFNVKRVIVRIKDPNKFSVYREYAFEMVSATTLAAEKIAGILSTPEEIEIIGDMGGGEGKIVRLRLASDAACGALSKLISQGVFLPVSLSDGGRLSLGMKSGDISPGAVVVGGVLSGNLKRLQKCCIEEKL